MKPLKERPVLASRIAQEFEWQVSLMWQPPKVPRPKADAPKIFEAIVQGDGNYAEAISAIMWHCGLSAEEAEEAVWDYVNVVRTLR